MFRNFDPQRWQFTVLAPIHIETEAMLNDLAVHDIRYIAIDKRPSLHGFFFRVGKEVSRGGYDLVHSHGFIAGMCAALPAFLTRTPHLLTSHDVINAEQFNGIIGRLKRLVMAKLIEKIDSIHSVSHDAQVNLLEYFPGLAKREERCIVISNGIEVERFVLAKPRDLHNELHIDKDIFLVGFIGRFMKQKGFRFLVEATDILRQQNDLPSRFLVLTFGDGGFIREEQQAIKEKGLETFFRFMPFTDNVASVIKGLNLVAMPSLWEACPLLAMEILCCGTSLVGSDCIGLREVLRDTPALVVKSRDGSGLADAIMREMKVSSQKNHTSFINEAVERFDVKKQSKKLQNLYEKLIG